MDFVDEVNQRSSYLIAAQQLTDICEWVSLYNTQGNGGN